MSITQSPLAENIDRAHPGIRRLAAGLAVCLLLGGVLSLASRTDSNWDLQNYHLLDAFEVLHGRIGRDYFVGGFQQYLNPTLDIPYFLLKFGLLRGHPMALAFLAGLPFGALIFVVLGIARRALGPGWAALAMAALGVSGATTVSEIGTSFGDVPVTVAVLAGLWAAMALAARPARAGAAAGLGLGLAVGLKFTTAVFAPGLALAVALLVWRGGIGAVIRAGLGFGCAGLAGFLLAWGWWGAVLWAHFGNPLYPLAGRFFVNAWTVAIDPRDIRFLPHDLLQWLFYPAWWVLGRSFVVSEEILRDPRFLAVGLAASAACLALALRGRSGALRSGRMGAARRREILALWGFAVPGYVCWLLMFSILRYAMPLEVLTGILLWTALEPVCPARRPWLRALVLLALCVAVTKPLGWGRIGYGQHLIDPPLLQLPAHALVLVEGRPIGFVVPYLAQPGQRFVHIDIYPVAPAERAVLHARLAAGEPAWLLSNRKASDPIGLAALSVWHLRIAAGSCQPIRSSLQRRIRLCRLVAAPGSGGPAR